MPTFSAPGVYVLEEPTGPRPIEAVGTSTAAMLGVVTSKGAEPRKPVLVTNWTAFRGQFVDEEKPTTDLIAAAFGGFANGLRRLWVVPVSDTSEIHADDLTPLEAIDDISILAAPGYANKASYDALITHAERMGDRFAILDVAREVPDLNALTQIIGAGPAPAPPPADGADPAPTPPRGGAAKLRPPSSDVAATYFPWLHMQDPLKPRGRLVAPPSGHIAGIYAETDARRGVHKAPANVAIRAALDASRPISRHDQEGLNPEGVNCIRSFPGGRGLVVWGARTLSADADTRYVPVRRLALMLKESIQQGTQWVVFEPNDYPLWAALRRDITAFMEGLWRDGALMGQTPAEAFFVKCDAEINPPSEVAAGRLNAIIGYAPVRPAEFVIFRIAHKTGAIEDAG